MPLNSKLLNDEQLEDMIQNLILSYGHESFQKSLQNMGISVEKEVSKPFEPLTIEIAINRFFDVEDEDSPLHQYADATITTYKSVAKNLLEFCQVHRKNLIPDVMTSGFLDEFLFTSKNNNTRNKKVSFLRVLIKTICYDQIENKRINNLFNGALMLLEADEGIPKYFQPEQLKDLVYLSKCTTSAIRNHAILWTLLGSAIRVDELHFKIEDIDERNGTIMVYPKRSKKVKRIRYINKVALQVLMNYIAFTYGLLGEQYESHEYGKKFVFDCSTSAIQKMVRGLIRKAKTIPDHAKCNYSVHSFRHTFAVNALKSGIDIYLISKYLGHKDIGTTQKYLNLFHKDLQDALDKMQYSSLKISYLKGDHAID